MNSSLLICRRCGALTPDDLDIVHDGDGQQIGRRCHCGGELVWNDFKSRQAEKAANDFDSGFSPDGMADFLITQY